MKRKTWIILGLVLLVGAGVYYYKKQQEAPAVTA